MKNKKILGLSSLILVTIGLVGCGTSKVDEVKTPVATITTKQEAATTQKSEWQKFSSNIDNFSILFPENPKETSDNSVKYPFNRYQLTLSTGVSYEVFVKNYGKDFNNLLSLFDNDESNLLKQEYKGFAEGYTQARKSQFPNSEIVFEPAKISKKENGLNVLNFSAQASEGITFLGQYILSNSKLYKFMYVANKDRFNQEDYDKFVNSFQLNNLPQTTVTTISQSTPQSSTLSVEDYYYIVPSKYLGMSIGDSKAARKESMKTLDLENDYIYMSSSNWDGSGNLAVFRSNGGEDLIAVSNSGCGPICQQNFYLLRYENGKWSDVTSKMLPNIDLEEAKGLLVDELKEKGEYDEKEFSFAPMLEIPQHGTTIKYYDQYSYNVLFEMKWTKGQFALQKCDKESSCYEEKIS